MYKWRIYKNTWIVDIQNTWIVGIQEYMNCDHTKLNKLLIYKNVKIINKLTIDV